jgi:PAS domain S-box-containing protein
MRSPTPDRSWLTALFERAPIGMCLARDGLIVDANPAYLHIFGFDRCDEVAGTRSLGRVAPESIGTREQASGTGRARNGSARRANAGNESAWQRRTANDW